MVIIFGICVIFISGVFFGWLLKKLKQPEVTGYLVAGIIIGPFVLKLIDINTINNMELFSTIALSFVSFLIGAEFKWNYVKRLGKKPFIIGLVCSILTMIIVTLGLCLIGQHLSFALICGAIAASTAPAAIMMIVKEYKAKGELTDTMLSVIGIDDVLSIIIFGFTIVIASFLESGNMSFIGLLAPIKEIVISLIVGCFLGITLGITSKIAKSDTNIICLILAHVLFSIVIANYADMSSLLMCMVMGIIFVNAYNRRFTDKVLDLMDYISNPLMIIFFVISGASLDFNILPLVGLVGLVFIITRSIGKILGSFIGTKLVKSPKNVCNYLGPTLLSETGIAIGLALLARDVFPDGGEKLMAVIISSSFIFDLFGPIIVKKCLNKAGEIK